MAHAIHFLERLERVSSPEVEFALGLYRDRALLSYLLGRLRLPEGAERVALSLDDPEEGPFLVVTRRGDFVTCLGKGMRPGDLPRVERARIEAVIGKAEALRARIDETIEREGPDPVNRMFSRVYDRGGALSREDFSVLATWQPLLYPKYVDRLARCMDTLSKYRPLALRMAHRPRKADEAALRSYGEFMWATVHLFILTNLDGARFSSALAVDGYDIGDMAWALVRMGLSSMGFRAAWVAAKCGKPQLRAYKRLYQKASSQLTLLNAGLGLGAIGNRHRRCAAEVRKALDRPRFPPESALAPEANPLIDVLSQLISAGFDDPEGFTQYARKLGGHVGVHAETLVPPERRVGYERVEDVPPDLALPLLTNTPDNYLVNPRDAVTSLAVGLPWVARAEAEDLYLPADYLERYRWAWTVADTVTVLRRLKVYYAGNRPVRRQPTPGRNAPCPCGSGKKYKRCCGQG